MELYTLLREFADSWALLAMVLFFIGAIAILFRPGASALHKDAASIPMRDDTLDREIGPATKTTLEPEDAR